VLRNAGGRVAEPVIEAKPDVPTVVDTRYV
jgi:hypothetical protein